MRIEKFKRWSAVAVLGLLASVACENRANADDLELGGYYNSFAWKLSLSNEFNASNEGGGSITVSSLNGTQLPWVYCVDIPDNVGAPGSYTSTVVTTNGKAWFGVNNPWASTPGVTLVGGSSTIAGQVAWLLDNYAGIANTVGKEEALQAAIWKTIYGSAFTVQDSGVNAAMNVLLTQLGSNTAALNSVFWLSPNGSGEQALVTNNIDAASVTTPEPSTMALAGLGVFGFLAYGWKRRKSS